MLSVVPGKRTSETVRQLVTDFKQHTEGRVMNLMTTDEYPVYETAILEAYGKDSPARTHGQTRPPQEALQGATA